MPSPNLAGYPDEVGKIILSRCATTGCHDNQSAELSGNLNLSTWEHLMTGSQNGASVIPYNSRQSPLFLFSNTYADLGVINTPSMPLYQSALSRDEVLALRTWIDRGAPDENDFVKFSNHQAGHKYYFASHGCDLVGVVDESSDLVMRYISVGQNPGIEQPSCIQLSPDGRYWYVLFSASDIIQKFNVSDDSYAGQFSIGFGNWRDMCIRNDSRHAYLIESDYSHHVSYVDLDHMEVEDDMDSLFLSNRLGDASISDDSRTLLICAQDGNFIYKLDVSDPDEPDIYFLLLDPGSTAGFSNQYKPQSIVMDPLTSVCYVACETSNEIRILNYQTNQLIRTVSVPIGPQKITLSVSRQELYVSCPDDSISYPGLRGSLSKIDLNSGAVSTIYAGPQPYGMVLDVNANRLIVTNRNYFDNGIQTHHFSDCQGRNGYLSYIDLGSFSLIPDKHYEVAVDPCDVKLIW